MKRAGSRRREAAFPIRAAVVSDPVTRYRMRQNERLKMRLDSADDVTRYHLKQAIRRNERAMRMDADEDDIDWITVNGSHIPLIDGEAVGGAEGNLNGEDFSEAKSEETSSGSSGGSVSSGVDITNVSSDTVNKTKSLIEKAWERAEELDEYVNTWGIRIDKRKYNVGDKTPNSHQLLQDQDWDEEGNPLYELGEGPYSGYFDLGELNGTCAIYIDPEWEPDVDKGIKLIDSYKPLGKYIYIIAGHGCDSGWDYGEVVIHNPTVLAVGEL